MSKNLYIIFGTTKGLGKAICGKLGVDSNNRIVAVNRKKISVFSDNVKNITLDLAKPVSRKKIEQIFNIRASDYGKIILINNAATIKPITTAGNFKTSDLVASAYVNYLNYSVIINEFIKKYGKYKLIDKRILNISSGAAVSPHHGLSHYCGAKAALEIITECIFKEQEILRKIKILALRPGVIDTGMQEIMRQSKKEDLNQVNIYRKLHKENRLSAPEEAAEKIIKILKKDKYWHQPILDINDIKD